jgi:hypothetical protein
VPTLIAHDIQPGGYYDAPQNDRTVVTLPSTDGADFLIAFYTANSIQGNLNPVFDSEGNVWTKIESAPPGDFDHDYNIASMGIYWCANPITSPTSQTFTVINLGGSLGTAHACLAVQAWGGLLDIAYDTQLWSGQQLSPYTQGPLPIEGIAFAAIGLGYDETIVVSATLGAGGFTLVDSLVSRSGVFGYCGMACGYKLVPISDPTSVEWMWTPGTGVGGAVLLGFTYTVPPPPTTRYGCIAPLPGAVIREP